MVRQREEKILEQTTLSVRAQVEALIARRNFFLVQASLEQNDTDVLVRISENARIATTPAQRKQFERDGSGWRFAAGGGLVVLDCYDRSVALVRKRDSGAPSYANHWTLGSGLSGSLDEFIRPDDLAVREATEEFIVAGPKGILIPTFEDDDHNEASYGAVSSSQEMIELSGVGGLFSTRQYEAVDAHTDSHPRDRNLCIFFGDEVIEPVRGIVAVDANTRGVDLLKVIRLKIPYLFSEIVILDGEEDREGRPLNAPIGCLAFNGLPKGEFVDVFQSGERLENYEPWNNRMTPVLAHFF